MSASNDPVYFLLVDDLEENLLSLEALLRDGEDLVLLKARSGAEALELLLKYDIALALLDVQMPGMDGFELAELMRGNQRVGHIPIIFLTAGSADRQRRFRGYEAGAVDFLHKPIEPDILRSKAKVFYDLYCQRRQLARQRDELKEYAEALKEADRHKDEFLAMLAHELRNPLMPIRNGLQILNMSSDPAETAKIRQIMDRQVTHLVRLIDDLLDVSRVSRGKIDLRREPVTINSVVQAAVEVSRPLIDSNGHTFTMEIPDEPLWIEADLTRLAQVLSNVLNNSAKYTPSGGRILLTVKRKEENVIVTISDNGIGIPPEMLPKIFELFIQGKRITEQSRGGLGIGLALSRQLVELHHGIIEAASPGAGQGSTFTIRLPLLENPAPPEAAPPILAAAPRRLKILVVDDHVSSAETTGQLLALLGHDIALAYDGPEAIEAAAQVHPDVIMLDIGLPSMSGYDVCRALRKDPHYKNTTLVAQTGWGQDHDREEAFDAGFDHHLTKPLDLEKLTAVLASVLAK